MAAPIEQIYVEAQRLSPQEKIALIKNLLDGLTVPVGLSTAAGPCDLRDLRGIGHGLWSPDEIQAYIDQERNAWE
jgi:hypothetical protein